jgi:hypothetical protein
MGCWRTWAWNSPTLCFHAQFDLKPNASHSVSAFVARRGTIVASPPAAAISAALDGLLLAPVHERTNLVLAALEFVGLPGAGDHFRQSCMIMGDSTQTERFCAA